MSNGSGEDHPDKSVARQEMSELNMSTKSLLGITLAMVLAGNAIAFGDPQGSSYVVSVKRSAPSVDRMGVAWPSRDTFRATAATVQFLMEFGYELKHFERTPGLPEWAARERFDIAAKLEHPMKNMDDRRALVRQVLANEFGLLTHTDTRQIEVLSLRRANPRSPLPKGFERATDCVPRGRPPQGPPQGEKPPCRLSGGNSLIMSTGTSMADLSTALSAFLKDQVIDKT
ncbi:MAG TPA: TIGR03435 family protein, partial [Gemmatimonadaceae bacterium]|nr:TIGR03435 family protein [Gemmatimonadaceae bacterium]